MKSVNALIFQEHKKRNILLLIICILLLISISIIGYLGYKNSHKKLPVPKNLNSFIKEENKKENIYSYIEVNIKPYLFGSYEINGVEEQNKFYLVMDNDNYLYIVYMNDETFKRLNTDNIKDNPIKIYGITKTISRDIKELVILSYNDLMNDEYLTQDNFKEYVGFVYLDTISSVNDSRLYYVGTVVTICLFLMSTIFYITVVIKDKKVLKSISDEQLAHIDAELQQQEKSKYSNMKFFMLKDIIVDFNNQISIINYKDIVWVYPDKKEYNGLLINKYLKVIDNKNKKYNVANTKAIDTNKNEILDDIINKIKAKNADIIVGKDKENKNKVKVILKDLKKKRLINRKI